MRDEADAWRQLPSATVSDCLDRLQAMDGGIRLLAGDGVAGRAFTVETAAGDSATLHLALQHAPPGSVLVVAAGGHVRRAVWGAILTEAAQRRGVRGLVVDGVVRDVTQLRASGFTVYARGSCPAGPHKGFRGRWDVAVSCGGVVVDPGDLVLGDADGVVVVPAGRAAEVAAAVAQRRRVEEQWRAGLRRGATTAELLGLVEPTPTDDT